MRLYLDSNGLLECASSIDDELRTLDELSGSLEPLRQLYSALEDPSAAQVGRLCRRVDGLARATHSRKEVLESITLSLVEALGSLDQAIDDAIEVSGRRSETWDG